MQLSLIIYAIVVIVLLVVIAIVSVLAASRKVALNKCPTVPSPFRSVMGPNVNYREEERNVIKTDKSVKRLAQYTEDAASEVATVFIVALVKWLNMPTRLEMPAGHCEVDWRNKTWKQVLQEVGLPVELYEDVIENEYRFIRSFKSTFEQFAQAITKENSTEWKFIDARKQEFKTWLKTSNFIAANVEKYMTALSQYGPLVTKGKSISMDIKSYGEVTIVQMPCTTAPNATQSTNTQEQNHVTGSFFHAYSIQQRIAFMVLITVVVMCIVAIILDSIWRLSPNASF